MKWKEISTEPNPSRLPGRSILHLKNTGRKRPCSVQWIPSATTKNDAYELFYEGLTLAGVSGLPTLRRWSSRKVALQNSGAVIGLGNGRSSI